MADPPSHAKSKLAGQSGEASDRAGTGDDPLGYFGTGSFDSTDETGPPLELSVGQSEPAPSARPVRPDVRGHARDAPPTPELSDGEVRIVADYGIAPTAWYLAPAYAWRVKLRQRALKKRVTRLVTEVSQAELARDAALAALATDLRSAAESDDRYADLLEPVRRIESAVGEQSAALASVSADREVELTRIDAERAPLEAKLAERLRAQAEKAAAVEQAERDHARADARLKRIRIEMRGVQEAAARAVGPQGGDMPPENRARFSELQTQAEAMEPDVAALAALLAASHAEHTNLTNQAAHLQAALAGLDARGHALDVGFQKQLSARSLGVAEVEAERTRALAQVGRKLVRRARGLGVYLERVDAVDAAEHQLARVSLDHVRHLAALDACDQAVVQRGLVVAALGVVLLLVLLWVVI